MSSYDRVSPSGILRSVLKTATCAGDSSNQRFRCSGKGNGRGEPAKYSSSQIVVVRQSPCAMCSSGIAERRRTAHFTVAARWGNSTTNGPASHSTTVSAPTGEPYVVHSTCMRGSEGPRFQLKGSPRFPTGPSSADAPTVTAVDSRYDLTTGAGRPNLHRQG